MTALTVELAEFLVSPEGRILAEVAAQLPGVAAERVLTLRKRGVTLTQASASVDLLDARHRARARFADANQLFFTSEMLAQATSPGIAAFHADCLRQFPTVADLGCGAGIDAIAMARAGIYVTAIDRDPARLVFARANAEASGIDADQIDFVEADVTALGWHADAVFWDPARRIAESGARVSRHGDRYEPPLSFLETLRGSVRGGCLKLSPALPDDELSELGGSVTFLSEDRTCKEACVRFGDFGDADEVVDGWSATLLPERIVIDGSPDCSLGGTSGRASRGKADIFVLDPDPALVRASALGIAADRLGADLISGADAYLTARVMPSGADRRLASAYRVIESMPYRAGVVGAYLRSHGIGRLVIKKRFFDREPDAVHRELGLTGKRSGAEATLILVRMGIGKEGHLAVICEPEPDRTNADI